MALDPSDLDDDVLAFLRERHLATLTTLRTDGTPHVVAVGFSYDAEQRVARVITWATAQKALNAQRMEAAGQHAAVCQVDGGRWLSLEGPVRLVSDGLTDVSLFRIGRFGPFMTQDLELRPGHAPGRPAARR